MNTTAVVTGPIVVTGASDDLIEVDGVLCEEFTYRDTNDDGDLLAFSSGVVLRIRYDSTGVWRITPIAGGSRVTITFAPVDDDYSDKAVLHESASWVVHGIAMSSSAVQK